MEPFIGEIRMFAGNFAPQGWATCDGQLMSISQWQALFSLLGTTYGGDGMSNFALPDLRSRAPIHASYIRPQNVTPYGLGQMGGQEQVTISTQQMPAHSHQVLALVADGNQVTPENTYLANGIDLKSGNSIDNYQDFSDTTLSQTYLNQKTITATGGGQPLPITSPVLAVTFIIALQGIWPPRP